MSLCHIIRTARKKNFSLHSACVLITNEETEFPTCKYIIISLKIKQNKLVYVSRGTYRKKLRWSSYLSSTVSLQRDANERGTIFDHWSEDWDGKRRIESMGNRESQRKRDHPLSLSLENGGIHRCSKKNCLLPSPPSPSLSDEMRTVLRSMVCSILYIPPQCFYLSFVRIVKWVREMRMNRRRKKWTKKISPSVSIFHFDMHFLVQIFWKKDWLIQYGNSFILSTNLYVLLSPSVRFFRYLWIRMEDWVYLTILGLSCASIAVVLEFIISRLNQSESPLPFLPLPLRDYVWNTISFSPSHNLQWC